jgi:hypothetical protein
MSELIQLKELEISQVVKSLKLPKTFMVKTNSSIIKVSYDKPYYKYYGRGYLNASFYISRTGLTFSGVLKYDKDELKELRGIYYFSSRKSIVFMSKSKMSRNVEEMKDIIKEQIQKLNIKNAIIDFNNWRIIINTEYKIKKAPLIQLTNTLRQGNLNIAYLNEIDFTPFAENYTYPVEENNKYFTWMYNHKVVCNLPFVIAKPTFTGGGEFILIYFRTPNESAEFVIKSDEHETVYFKSDTSKILAFYHPKPIRKFD